MKRDTRKRHTRSKAVRSLWKRTVSGLAGIVVVLTVCWACYHAINHWRIEHAISRFVAEPSQAGADTLARLIDNGAPTATQGERILELLLTPTITTRGAYPLGRPAGVALELPFAVRFGNASLARRQELLYEDQPPRSSEGSGGDVLSGRPQLRVLYPVPRRPGTYHLELRQRYTLNLHHREGTWSWRPLSGPFPRCLLPHRDITTMEFRSIEQWDYACSIGVDADVVVVEESQAERIELESNPDRDQAMQRAFSSRFVPLMRLYATPSGRRSSTGGLEIIYHDLPMAVGFLPMLRLSDGREILGDRRISYRLHARAGSSGQFSLSPSMVMPDEPGSYTGTLVLRADPNGAYRDPAIKTIWDGTLEFPISFAISEESN